MVEVFPIIPLLITTSLVMLALAMFAWRKRFSGNAAVFLSLSMLGVALYCFGYALELASETLLNVMLWVRFQHLGIFLIVPNWLLFAISVSGYHKRIDLKLILALSIIPIYLFLSAQTLGWLNLAHHNPRLQTLGPYQVLAYDRNLFNYLSIGYYTLCLGASTVLFTMMFFRAAPSARNHLSLYLIGSLLPWWGAIFHNLNLVSSGLDITPLLLGVSALFFTYGFLRFRILDLIPLARNAIFENIVTGVLITDIENQIVDFNPACKKIFPEVKLGASANNFFGSYPELDVWIKEETDDRVDFQKCEGDKTTNYRVSRSEITDRKLRIIGKIYSFYENTQEKLLVQKLEQLATHDGLTGIFNRQHFDHLAKVEISRLKRYGGELSMVMIDLDSFKQVNDTYGHDAGDQVLKRVAQTLQCQLRQSDSLARYGGEEFVILLPETDQGSAKNLCERLKQSLGKQMVDYDGYQIELRASFGMTTIQYDSNLSLDKVYKLADTALYMAKECGGNKIIICDAFRDLSAVKG